MRTVKGHCSQGKLKLYESPQVNECDVIVTFIEDNESVDLGINREQACDLRNRLSTFADDWNAPEMDIYDRV